MDTLEIRDILSNEWRTDNFINKQQLCYNLRRSNTIGNHFILEYDINDYDWHAEQLSIKDEKNVIRLKTYLNKNKELVDLVQSQSEIEFDIDLTEKKMSFRLKYFFRRQADNENLRRRKAIVLETFSYEEFRNLIQYVGYGDFEQGTSYDYFGYFTKVYQFYFQKASTPEELLFLYTNTPDFVFERMLLDNEKVMDHLITLADYDDTGFWSGWKDGSSALVNVLKAFSSHIYLLERFKKEPELCNKIYYGLDGISYIDGKPQPNRVIFANILQQFCLFSQNRPKLDASTFLTGKGYKINTDVMELSGNWLGFGQSDSKTFFLQQQQEYISDESAEYETDDLGITTTVKSQSRMKNLNDGAQYHPLEMVYFVNEKEKYINPETGEQMPPVTMIVPAIYVKAMADAEKWEEINYFIRITADILAVTLGIVTLATTGNPYLILAAMADLSLAGIDLTVQALRQEIAKLPGGESFLEDWDLIYGVGGIIIAAPQLIVSAYRGIFVLIPKAAKNVQQGLKAMAISLFLDLNSGVFQRKDLRVFSPTEWVIPSAGFFSKAAECDALVRNGAFFMELDAAAIMENINKGNGINPDVIGAISSNRKFALVYKGEIIAQGSRYDKAYQETLANLRRASYDVQKVKSVLEVKFLIKNKGSLDVFHGTSPNAVISIRKNGVLLSANIIELDFNTKGQGAFYTSSSYKETVGYNKYKFGSRGLQSDIIQFDIPEKELLKLNIKVFDTPTEEWADFVTKARTGNIVHEYDIVIGPKLKNPWDVKEGIALPKAHKEFQIAITSEKGAKVLTKYLQK
ncbi:hypothetical protein DRF60_01585 [Chryseobacterium elymi]|uniref:Uncharacterized protein n=1 Tax=Chryseobacterium elymi TaxID=395936 RepID=A0A3D9DR03_9FLAO|nr:DUF3990 domain-containing protein [Chryseobacterium elymi]REC80428.1 hypothetical protein DRF60_01585 [Chryseobacterium elymi]